MAHIAWLGKKSPFCGNVTYGLSTTNALKHRGYLISFIHFDSPHKNADQASITELINSKINLGYHYQPEIILPYFVKSQIYTIPSRGAQRELRESLERLKPDLVHASLALSPLDFRLPDLCHQLKIPLVATFHPPFDISLRNLTAGTQYLTYQVYAPALARFDRVIVFSELQAEMLRRLGVESERLAVIPNGIDTNYWIPARPESKTLALQHVRQKLGSNRIFLYMGRIATEKNVEALLKAWRFINPNGCKLVIVGDGPLRNVLESNNQESDIYWWGYEADRETRVALLQIAEVFILPSLVEGLSLALLEAMASGTACIATDAGADGEVLEKGAGIVISTKSVVAQLKTLLPILIDQPMLTAELGYRARLRALERYTINRNIDCLEKLYSDLLISSSIRV